MERRAIDPVIADIHTKVGRIDGRLETALENQDTINTRVVQLLDEYKKDHDYRIRKLEDWSLATKVAAFFGAGGTLSGLARLFGLM